MNIKSVVILFVLFFASWMIYSVSTKKSRFDGNEIKLSYAADYDLVRYKLPGQPKKMSFRQFAGNIVVDELNGRSLFYYFVEAVDSPSSKPLLLWLNGGPGCSSVGNGAFIEHGPFGVKSDGRTLYEREYSWNKVVNILYLDSPAGVGFSYSNMTSDYNTTTDIRTAQDSYMFMVKWLERFPEYKNNDLHIAGESYGGFYVPELADLIVQNNLHTHTSLKIQLRSIMVGNGMTKYETDKKGIYDYLWSHALISDETYEGLIKTCIDIGSSKCKMFQQRLSEEMGIINVYHLYTEACSSGNKKKQQHGGVDPCERKYVRSYMNLNQVQNALHVTSIPYHWELCSYLLKPWRQSPSTMIPVYKLLISAGIRILVYSGDLDVVIPVTSTRYAIRELHLTIKNSWKPWFDNTKQFAGYKVEYDGLVFMTVYGAGHEVPRFSPDKAFSLLKLHLEKS